MTLIPQCTRTKSDVLRSTTELMTHAPPPFLVNVKATVAGRDERYWKWRCLYILMHANTKGTAHDGEQALITFHDRAEEYLGVTSYEAFVPHLSLAYSDCDQATRESWVPEVQSAVFAAGPAIMFDKVQVWETEGTVETWSLVETFPLPQSTKHGSLILREGYGYNLA